MLSLRRVLLAALAAVVLYVIVGVVWDGQRRVLAPPPAPNQASGGGRDVPRSGGQDSSPPVWFTPEPGVYPPPTPPLPQPAPYAAPTTPTASRQTPTVSLTATVSAPPSPTPTRAMTATPSPSPTRPTPTRTLRAVAPAEVAEAIFIESLRRKKPDAGDIEFVRVWEERSTFNRSYIRYRSEGQRVTGYINVPSGVGPFPAIVMNHGYFLQERYTSGLGTVREADYLAERGYVVAVSDFRSYAGSDKGHDGGGHFGVDWVYDSMNLMEAVKRLPQVDPTRLGVWGHSTGGLNALQATVSRQDIRATVVVSTMSADMTQTLGFLRNWRPWVADEVVRKFGSPQARPDAWARMSPINYLAEASGPIQVHHGTDDDEVTPEFSARLWNAMQAAGTPGEYYIYIGADHLWQRPGPWRQMMERTLAFYDRYLKGKN